MNNGEKFQKVKQKQFIMILLSIVMIMGIMVSLNIGKRKRDTNKQVEYEVLEKQRFVTVNTDENHDVGWNTNFDLQKKLFSIFRRQ